MEEKDIKTWDRGVIPVWLSVLLCAAAFISLTFNNNVWLDEAFTGSLVNTDMAGVIRRSMADTLPPLYNIILRLTTLAFSYSVPVMKLTSAAPMIFTLILGATVVRKRFGNLCACIFILAITVMPQMMFFGVEIRMYSLGFFFATACGIFLYELLEKPSRLNRILFSLCGVLAGYSHHFAFVTAGFLYLFLLIYCCREHKRYSKDKDRELHPILLPDFLKCLCLTFILYFPCLLVTLKQLKSVSGYFSMPRVTIPVFIKYCRYPFTVGSTPLSIALLLLTAFLFLSLIFRKEKTLKDMFSFWCFITFYLVLIFGTAVSAVMTANIFVDRYLFFALGLIWLFFSIEASRLKPAFVCLVIALELAVGTFSYVQAFVSEYAPGANETISWLAANVSEGDSLYTLEEYEELAYCLTFYDNRLTNYETLDEAVKAAGDNDIWVAVLDGYEGSEGYGKAMDGIAGEGYSLDYEGTFRFDRYMYKMYKIIR
ncbi:MAG: glycosyltransferase family 39 protein [Lachnospiraceae bacterium]|nr:glycosyltransferase family 39 protein [Lachnospiraceae bacterium]